MADQSIFRITKEISDLQKNSDLSLAVAFRDRDVRNVKALIIGPHETPYEFGFFEFAVKFNKEYPRKSPAVTGTTTNGGRCRFNPNIYANGKVCLSILGTWRGERGEEWSAAQGLESILLSIQSLMSSNPYENEPGFEDANEESDKKNQKEYVAKIRHESLRISVIQRMEEYLGISSNTTTTPTAAEREDYDLDMDDDDYDGSAVPWEPFKDLIKRRFLWYYDSYLDAIQKAKEEVKDGQQFSRMPFEGSSNTMEGRFNYTDLERRLRRIKATLETEADRWAAEGLTTKHKDNTVAVNLSRQFEQIKESYKRADVPHSIELVDGNPFVWHLTYFGRPMTNLDGGLFRIKLRFSPRFPEEQPRVTFETRMFHHRIAADGTPCYFPNPSRREDVKQHIEAIIEALEEEHPPYDPRTLIHPEAHKLFWGGADDRKIYNRRLRRSVQQSMEDM
ncbi:ubiquitin-conjugating enzyme/RWD-like protein [Pseudomassariella vexata]|uniref:Ubiquitin-conjugating enzyme E2 Z n=1 Tax=Pseudomassariella vexata TaxID=1141098 RepID=A0A1Y2DLR1_9PEZI|nr:ubiquitin-conjugating enzyme/RWD-like protein [Pseudomassariella vexata]ORY60151.1 ubiquitin-conjugating enzyme/RWD-like protein [Pseudomassariella vexata]